MNFVLDLVKLELFFGSVSVFYLALGAKSVPVTELDVPKKVKKTLNSYIKKIKLYSLS